LRLKHEETSHLNQQANDPRVLVVKCCFSVLELILHLLKGRIFRLSNDPTGGIADGPSSRHIQYTTSDDIGLSYSNEQTPISQFLEREYVYFSVAIIPSQDEWLVLL
jgi:hypothetical protein